MTNLSFYTQVCNDLDILAIDNGFQWDSLEGLNSNVVGRLFVAVADTFSGLLRTFASNIANCKMSLKRSEINEFVQSNMLKVRTVDKLPYEKLVGVQVDIPANMKGTYKAAVSALTMVYTRLNALNNAKLVNTAFTETLNAINTNDAKLHKQIESTAVVMRNLLSTARPAVDMCMNQFNGKFDVKVDFDKVFLSTQEWLDVRKTLIENENRLQDVKPLTEIVAVMEGTLKEIATASDANNTPVTPADLRHMADTAKSIALVLDAYGMATTRQMALEHNLVLCINNLYDTVK